MASTQFPSTLSHEKKEFIKAFYSVSDVPGATDKYVDFLTEDVDFIMGLKAIHGVPGQSEHLQEPVRYLSANVVRRHMLVTASSAVRKMRETMWSDVTTHQIWALRHVLIPLHFVLTCQVSYGLKNGTSVEDVGWAARMVFAQGGELKMKSYQAALLSTLAMFQVWLDAAPLADAVKEMHKN
ncbi:BQ5605_C041g11970 [Microbotryum silenes-dioicae]|uniref:BQ5605_C041g11970 protein n=1 Tax=Microbotryum silenes-dioicae TaxID=796604 RepID=A0A2X0PJ76_9BASI|nr:BQ5605_C041g11970 [Microbotryum silenes-dioicae]